MSEHHRKRSLCYAKYSGYVIEDSSENQRDFFYVIFVANPDFEHHPKDGVEGQRGKAPKPKFIPCFLTLLQFVFLLESWPKKILLLPDFLWSAALRCHILFCSVIHPGVRVVICHLAYFDLKIRVKTWDSSVFLSCYADLLCDYGLLPLCQSCTAYFPFYLQGQIQVFSPCWSLPSPHLHFRSQERAGATLSARISSGS